MASAAGDTPRRLRIGPPASGRSTRLHVRARALPKFNSADVSVCYAAKLKSLPARQREVLQSIAVEAASIKDTAAKFAMSEGAVRVALHRGLASLTAKLREQ